MEGLHSLSFCVCVCICVSVYACSHGVHVYKHARGGQRSTLSVFFILLLDVELTDLSGWLVSSRNPPASTLRLQACTTMAGFPNKWWWSELMSSCLPREPFPHYQVTLTDGALPGSPRFRCPCCPCRPQNCHPETPLTGHQRSLQDPYSISGQRFSSWADISEDMACLFQPAFRRHGLLEHTQKEVCG